VVDHQGVGKADHQAVGKVDHQEVDRVVPHDGVVGKLEVVLDKAQTVDMVLVFLDTELVLKNKKKRINTKAVFLMRFERVWTIDCQIE